MDSDGSGASSAPRILLPNNPIHFLNLHFSSSLRTVLELVLQQPRR